MTTTRISPTSHVEFDSEGPLYTTYLCQGPDQSREYNSGCFVYEDIMI